MDLSMAQACLALAALGVLSHLSFFIRMDALDSAPTLGLLLLTIPALLTVALNTLFAYSYINALITASAWVFSYLGGTFTSMLIYRMWFHPLRHYEGPFWSKLTQFHHVANITKRVDHFRRVDALHEKHGEYVRIGPNLLSVADPAIVDVVHGPHTAFYKDNWYQGGKPLTTLHQMTDRAMHDRRRKHGWDKVSQVHHSFFMSPHILGLHYQIIA
jgi:cytochrome P450 family 628